MITEKREEKRRKKEKKKKKMKKRRSVGQTEPKENTHTDNLAFFLGGARPD
jgi:hypothetical protein